MFKKGISHLLDRPSVIILDIALACNIKCVMCSLDQWGPKGFMSLDVVESMGGTLSQVPSVALSCSGEPLFHPKFKEILRRVRELAPTSYMEFHSNGMMLTESVINALIENRLDFITISIDGADKETFNRIRLGANFEEVLENVRLLQTIKKKKKSLLPKLAIRFVAMQSNINKLSEVLKLAKNIGASIVHVENLESYSQEYFQEIVYRKEFREKASKIFKNARRYAKEIGMKVELPVLYPREKGYCLTTAPVISYDGKVRPCFYKVYTRPVWNQGKEIVSEEIDFGNVLDRSFWNIWSSPDYRSFRKKLKKGGFTGKCEHCLASQGMLVSMPDE